MIALIQTKNIMKTNNLKTKSKAAMMLLFIFALCALNTTVLAQTEVATQTFDRVNYTLWSDGTASVEPSPTAYGTLNLRGTLTYNNNTYTLTRIADNAFANRTALTGSLTIPNTVTHIGSNAFYNCTGLTGTLTLPTALLHIGVEAFRKCGFSGSLNLPNGLLTIGSTAFYQCESLTGQLILPATLTSIGEFAFDHCRGFSGTLTLPPLLTEIEPYTFYGIPFTGDFVIPEGITTIGAYAFVVNRFSSINIGDGVTTIGNYAFSGSIASQLTLGRNVTSVGEKAFQCGEDGYPAIYIECKSTIPATLGADVFKNYGIGWGGITVPCGAKDNYLDPVYGWSGNGASVLSVMEAASQDVCIDGVYYRLVCSGHTATVMNSAFLESSQGASYSGDVFIPATVEYEGITYSVTHIAQYAFYFCQSVTSVTLGSNIQSIGDDAFGWCSGLGRIVCQGTTPPTMTSYDYAFFSVYQNITLQVPCGALASYQGSNWNVNKITMMEGAMVEMDGLHYQILCGATSAKLIRHSSYTDLASVYLEESVTYEGTEYPITEIEAGAFDGCEHLQWFDCHANLLSIGDHAFRNCDSLEYLGLYHIDTPPTVGTGVFDGMGIDTLMLMVPFCSRYEYAIHPVWGQFGEIQPDGECQYNFIGMGSDQLWSNPENWAEGEVPGEGAQVGIMSDCEIGADVTVGSITIGSYYDEEYGCYEHLTVKSGNTLTANNFIYTAGDARNFVIEDGAQVYHPNTGAQATVEKNITAYTPNTKDGWHLVSSPAIESFAPTADNGFLANEYDLYFYDEPTHYWRNHKPNGQYANFNIEPLKGYLYANSANNTLGLTGTLRTATETVNVPLSYTTGIPLAGFNLVGNPFAHNVTTFTGSNVATEVYRMNQTMDEVAVGTISASNPLKPGEGFFVKATGEDATITFNANAKGETEVLEPVERPTPQASKRSLDPEPVEGSKGATIQLEITQNGLLIDRFILKRDGEPLEKFTLNENSTKIFATDNAQDWAVVLMEGNEQAINFKAAKNGTYTLNVNIENMDVDYLHLIDNMTGADVDLLVHSAPELVEGPTQYDGVSTGSTTCYTFTAKTTDYASRFRLVFNADDASTGSASDAPFAFVNNGNIVITADADDATLQVIDLMGRVIRTVGLSQCGSRTIAGMTPGVYVLRLIDGDNIRTQKIVIE